VISIQNLSKIFEEKGVKKKIIKTLSLEIGRGEWFGLVGESATGKTTLLRMIKGTLSPSEGSIYIDGVRINDLPPDKRGVGHMLQSARFFEFYTVGENIGLELLFRGTPKAEIHRRVAEVAEMVGIPSNSRFLDRRCDKLSGGEQKRVALARALVTRPRVLLLDEPLASLDETHKKYDILKDIQGTLRKESVTVIYVTHNPAESTFLDRIALLSEGCIVQTGTLTNLYTAPASLSVMSFFGHPTVNVKSRVEMEEVGFENLPAGATFGVRPEDIELTESGVAMRVVSVRHLAPAWAVTLTSLKSGLTLTARTKYAPTEGEVHKVLLRNIRGFDQKGNAV
jgi:ABC-type sugar transport system ATPase subunit